MSTADEPFDSRSIRDVLALWFGLLGPPTAFLLNLEITYALVPSVCSGPRLPHAVLHLITVLSLAVSLLAGMRAWRNHQRSGGRWPLDSAGPVDRSRLLSAVGLMSSAFFSLLILGHWIPIFFLNACLRPT